jgi:hypothetical protein
VVLVLWALGCLGIPFLALVISDADPGVFIVTAVTLGPLALLLASSGRRDDHRPPSAGFSRRAPTLAVVAGIFAILAVVAAGFGNRAWLPCFWLAVFGLALARSWGFRLRLSR